VSSVTVMLPPGFSYVPGSTTGLTTANPAISGQTLTWTGPFPLNAMSSAPVDFKVTVSEAPGTYTIDADATAVGKAVIPVTDAAPITVEGLADLSLSKTAAPATVTAGDAASTSTFTLTATNNGPTSATGVVVTDPLPAGLTLVFASPGCTETAGTVTCDVGDLASGASATVTLTVSAAADAEPGLRANTAMVSAAEADPDPDNNAATADITVVPAVPPPTGSDFSIAKSAPDGVAGTNLTWTIPVENDGPDTASGATVTDPLPAGLTFVSATVPGGSCSEAAGTITCTLPTMAAGDIVDVTLVTATSPGLVPGSAVSAAVSNTATVHYSDDPVPGNNTATGTATIFAQAHLVSSKTGPPTVVAGDLITYTLHLSNAGPSDAASAIEFDELPPEVEFVAASSDPRCSLADTLPGADAAPNTVVCQADSLAAGADDSFTVTALVPPATGNGSVLTNSVYAQSAREDRDPVDVTSIDTDVVNEYDLTITKTPSQREVAPGEPFSYTITVTNHGPSAALNVMVSDHSQSSRLLGGLAGTEMNDTICPVLGIDFSCTIPEMLPGASVSIVMPARTAADTPPGTVLINHASVAAEFDTNPDNTSTATVLVTRGIPVTG
jgi:large repetitive protein